jgi:hypothetical protein
MGDLLKYAWQFDYNIRESLLNFLKAIYLKMRVFNQIVQGKREIRQY